MGGFARGLLIGGAILMAALIIGSFIDLGLQAIFIWGSGVAMIVFLGLCAWLGGKYL